MKPMRPLWLMRPVMLMEITFMDMDDNCKKYGTFKSLRYIHSSPFSLLISSLGLPIFFLRIAGKER